MLATVYDHVRPAESDHPDGIYRVVGRSESGVTVLRVADADGQRVNTGRVLTIDRDEFEGFEPAANPDGNRSLGSAAATKVEMTYWSLRVFVEQLAANPSPTAVAMALLLVGAFGDRLLTLPDAAFGGLILIGSLSLAYVGSGRL